VSGNEKRRVKIQKSFPDRHYGSLGKALDAAIAFRNEMLSSLGRPMRSEKTFSWKDNPSTQRRRRQAEIGKSIVHVGVGEEAARKAYGLGASRLTCTKIRQGYQSTFHVNHGGWRSSRIEDFGINYTLFPEQAETVRSLVVYYGSFLSEVERSEIVSEVLEILVTQKIRYNLETLVKGWVWAIKRRRQSGNRRYISLDLNGDREILSHKSGKPYGRGILSSA
jgi:hypothetical protein